MRDNMIMYKVLDLIQYINQKVFIVCCVRVYLQIQIDQDYISMSRIKTLKDGAYEYNQKELLGQGSFASVYKGIITKNNRTVAVRLLPLKLIKQYGDKIKEIIRGEVGVLKDLSLSESPDTIFTTKIYDCFMTENNVTMILQYCPQGNLDDIIKKGPLTQKEALPIIYQLARGLQFIASEKVVHRDIKPDNVFIKKEGRHKIFKLGDFGFAVKKQINQEIVGTPIFMSPQLFREEDYGSEVDVWAFGLMAHYVLFKQFYFIGASQKVIKQKVLSQQYTLKKYHKDKISSYMADFLTQCLQMDKRKRLSATKISQHPVFNSVRQQINQMICEVRLHSSQLQSEMMKSSTKGKVMNAIIKYSFMRDLGYLFSMYQPYNLASLYLYKYGLGQLTYLKKSYENRQNFVHTSDWNQFCQSDDYKNMYGLLQTVNKKTQQSFEGAFNSVIPMVQNRYGPDVAKGVSQNLGNGPYSQINPNIPVYQIKTNWIPKLKQKNNPQSYQVVLQCLLVCALLENKQVDFDFSKFQMQKTKMSVQQKCGMLEAALKNLH